MIPAKNTTAKLVVFWQLLGVLKITTGTIRSYGPPWILVLIQRITSRIDQDFSTLTILWSCSSAEPLSNLAVKKDIWSVDQLQKPPVKPRGSISKWASMSGSTPQAFRSTYPSPLNQLSVNGDHTTNMKCSMIIRVPLQPTTMGCKEPGPQRWPPVAFRSAGPTTRPTTPWLSLMAIDAFTHRGVNTSGDSVMCDGQLVNNQSHCL